MLRFKVRNICIVVRAENPQYIDSEVEIIEGYCKHKFYRANTPDRSKWGFGYIVRGADGVERFAFQNELRLKRPPFDKLEEITKGLDGKPG